MRKLSTAIAAAAALTAATAAVAASGPAARADAGRGRPRGRQRGRGPGRQRHAVRRGPQRAGRGPRRQPAHRPVLAQAADGGRRELRQRGLRPRRPLFQHYLSPAAYTARFGATSTEAASVESWLESAGFTGVSADSGRDYVTGTAPVSTIDTALRTQLRYYRPTAGVNAGGYPLRANDGPVSLPASVAASVLGVTGLENAAPVKTYATP